MSWKRAALRLRRGVRARCPGGFGLRGAPRGDRQRLDAVRLVGRADERADRSRRASPRRTSSRCTRQQVQLDGTADSSPIYLHGVQVGGAHARRVLRHDDVRQDRRDRRRERRACSGGSRRPATRRGPARAQITTATPVADPEPHSRSTPRRPTDRSTSSRSPTVIALWSASITKLPAREKIAAVAQLRERARDRDDRRLHRRRAAVPGTRRDARPGERASSCTSGTRSAATATRLIDPASCPASDSAIWGAPEPSSIPRPATCSSRPATRRGTARRTGATRCSCSTPTRRS